MALDNNHDITESIKNLLTKSQRALGVNDDYSIACANNAIALGLLAIINELHDSRADTVEMKKELETMNQSISNITDIMAYRIH